MKKYIILSCLIFLVGCKTAAAENTNEKFKNSKNKFIREGIETMAKNKMITTESGLQYEVMTMGTGEKPEATDKVEVHYHGTLLDGTVFDSSVDRGKTIKFGLNQVIKGWTEGLQLMPIGSKFKFTIIPELAYGDRDMGSIPPNSTLIFEVELFDIEKPFVDTDFTIPTQEVTLESGLRYLDHIAGDGEITKVGNTVSVHYSGFLANGTKFDSSHDRGQPFFFYSGRLQSY